MSAANIGIDDLKTMSKTTIHQFFKGEILD